LYLLQLVAEIAGFSSALAILVFALAQAWLAFQYWRTKNIAAHATEAPAPWKGDYPSVLVQLPIYNEQYVVERLLQCVAKIDYPHDKLAIQLLDDSTDETTAIAAQVIAQLRQQGLNIVHVRRPVRHGFKAGALEYGLSLNNSEYIAIFDADFLPRPDFIKQVIAYFADPKVGMVQTRWEHLNADYSLITRMMAFAIDTHFSVEHGGRQASDSFINFNGTGGMWRRRTIEDAGGWKSDTLTEDLDLSFRSQIRGWKFIFAETITTPSELPVQMSAVRSQQFRWTKGAAETGRKTLSELWHSSKGLMTKVVGSFHMLNSFIFIFMLLFGLSAAVLPFVGIVGFGGVSIALNIMIGVAMLATIFTYWTAQRSGDFAWSNQRPLYILFTTVEFIALATGLSVHCSAAVLQALMGKSTPFVRTPKLAVTAKGETIRERKAYQAVSIPPGLVVEILLALMFVALLLFSFGHQSAVFAGVYLFYAVGFGMVSFLSLREILSQKAA
jgi:cellulose synthase/poly-beta-1,6-N-acetylglucosamine synthase-like glycosyltransferase